MLHTPPKAGISGDSLKVELLVRFVVARVDTDGPRDREHIQTIAGATEDFEVAAVEKELLVVSVGVARGRHNDTTFGGVQP